VAADSPILLGPLLKDVSRSFYTTLRILPGSIRSQIGLAYLLARTTDTIADTDLLPVEQRLDALDRLRRRITGTETGPIDLGDLAGKQSSAAERVLLERCEEALSLLDCTATADRNLIRDVLQIITSGQELDLRRFATASVEAIVSLQTDAELADYTYRVAGCVGEFWTRICRSHIFPNAKLDDSFLLSNGVRFGKGLQLVNILRDLPADLRNGRCYVPVGRLAALGLTSKDLLQGETEPRFRALYDQYLALAEAHLRAGWAYTKALPRRQIRVRLACAWPILIGLDTIKLLRHENVLDPSKRIKVSRSEIKRIIRRSILLYPLWQRWDGLVS